MWRRDRILYFDFEMSSKQFQRRYTDEKGQMYCFPEGFMRMEMNPAKIRDSQDFETVLIAQIRRQITLHNARVVIIDNLGFVCTQSGQADAAGRLMRQLKEIQSATGVSMMVIGHTPKRDLRGRLIIIVNDRVVYFMIKVLFMRRELCGHNDRRINAH